MIQDLQDITKKTVWIGGIQDHAFRNDTGPENDPNLSSWEWADGENWYDDNGALWQAGEPNNAILGGKGEHFVLITSAVEYIDKDGCTPIAPKTWGIYILPVDFADVIKYPNCDLTPLTMGLPQDWWDWAIA
jgi:hypothetical protein